MLLHKAFIEIAKNNPEKLAIIDEATKTEANYERILIGSLIVAKFFKRFESKNVGIMIPNSLGCAVSMLGALMAEKTPVMINYSTGAVKNSEYAQDKCYFKTIVTSKKLADKLNFEPIEGMIFIEDLLKEVNTLKKVTAAATAKLPTSVLTKLYGRGNEEDTAVILFTSGSEKDPKAVQLSHKNISHNIHAFNKIYDFTEDDIFLLNLPVFHVFGLTVTFWTPILSGCAIITHPNPLDYRGICRLIRNKKPTVMIGTPSFFYGYLRKSEEGDFSSIKVAFCGADKLSHQVSDGYLKKHNLQLREGYGATETSPVISTNTPTFHKTGSVGKPMPGVKIKILNIDTDEVCAPNIVGKIHVKGDLVMKGYFSDIEETSLHIHNGWYDTGDMGMIDKDGFLHHKGRLKRFVKVGGEMVSLVQVESVLEQVLPDGTICCAVDVPNEIKGADIVVAITTQEVNLKQVKKHLNKELPSIAIPREYYVLEDLPMMPSGKVNFREVEKICRELRLSKSKKKKKV